MTRRRRPLLELFDSPLGEVLHAAAVGRLDDVEPLSWRQGAAVAVVMAAAGYPEAPRKGDAISGVAAAEALGGVRVLQAGTSSSGEAPGALVTNGGRVLAVTATGDSVDLARRRAYAGVHEIDFAGAQFRTDIAAIAAASPRKIRLET